MELTKFWAKTFPDILFYSMHPGWSHTPGVEKSLPRFFSTMKDSLRTAAEGADTIVWAAVVDKVRDRVPNGSFLFDRQVARQHLPLAGTQSSDGLVENLVYELDALLEKYGCQ